MTWDSFDGFEYTNTKTFDDDAVNSDPWFIVYNNYEMKCFYKNKVIHKVQLPFNYISSITKYYDIGGEPPTEH